MRSRTEGPGGWLVVPRFAHQVSQLVQQLPQAFQDVQNNMMQYGWFQQLVEVLPDLEEIAPQRELLPQVTGTLSSILNALANFILGPVFKATREGKKKV